MTEPVAPWSEYAHSLRARIGERWDTNTMRAAYGLPEWRGWRGVELLPEYSIRVDELRPPETDEEPWDVLDAAIVGTAWWSMAVAAVLGLLLLVLAVLGIRKAVRR